MGHLSFRAKPTTLQIQRLVTIRGLLGVWGLLFPWRLTQGSCARDARTVDGILSGRGALLGLIAVTQSGRGAGCQLQSDLPGFLHRSADMKEALWR